MVQRGFYSGKLSEERAATKAPHSPGASRSPQRPGQTPDHTDLRGQLVEASPFQAGPARRPMTQYGTAQEISNLLPAPNESAAPSDFEQSPASFQEQRKAYPWQNPPVRPTSAFALDQGISSEPPALPANEAAALAESSAVEG